MANLINKLDGIKEVVGKFYKRRKFVGRKVEILLGIKVYNHFKIHGLLKIVIIYKRNDKFYSDDLTKYKITSILQRQIEIFVQK